MAGVWLACACGPSIVVDGAEMEDDDASTRTTGPDDDTGDNGEGTNATSPTTTSPTTTPTTVDPSLPTTAESGGSESTTGVVSCDEIMLESAYCMYAGLGSLQLIGLDSGEQCEMTVVAGDHQPWSLVWVGDDLVTCDAVQRRVGSIDTFTGEHITTDQPCEAIAPHPLGFVVLQTFAGEPMVVFASFDDALTGSSVDLLGMAPQAATLTTADGLLYAAWHSTDHLEVWDLALQTRLDDLYLERYDDWIYGMSIVDNTVYALGHERLVGFDISSGARLVDIPMDGTYGRGLACQHGG